MPSFARLLAIVPNTGQLVTFKDERVFFECINTKKSRLCNLDKCYLYLYLFLKKTSHHITKPRIYSALFPQSLFLKEEADDLFEENVVCNTMAIPDENLLTEKLITIYVCEGHTLSSVQSFQFRFSSAGYLEGVVIQNK
jgi:hypothetical protein